jgi:hypothetical protein
MAKDKRNVWVKSHTAATFKYGFGTTINAADSVTLGHNNISTIEPTLLFGVNAPKPGRCTIEKTSESVNSYYSIEKRTELKKAGHRVSSPRGRVVGTTRFAVPCYVTMTGGWKYAWYMRKTTYNKITSDLAGLGIQVATGADKDLVFGPNKEFKPPKASKTIAGQDGTDVITVFCDESKLNSLPNGWVAKGADGGGVTLD